MDKNEYVYAEIRKLMYGLPHAGLIANYFFPKLLHHMPTTSVGTHQAYAGTKGDQSFF